MAIANSDVIDPELQDELPALAQSPITLCTGRIQLSIARYSSGRESGKQ